MTIGPNSLVAWSPRTRPDAVETYFEVRQTALDELGATESLQLASDLIKVGARMSRTDGYFDDRERHAEPTTVADAFRSRNTLTHIRRIRVIREFVTRGDIAGAVADGETTYIGSAKSAAMVRVYDKAAESGRDGAGVRWELQLRGEHASQFAVGAVMAGEELGRYLLACIRGLIDFRDRSGQERGDRAPMLTWWAAIVADADRVGLSKPARVDSLARRSEWLARQVAPSLALLYFAKGTDWVNDLLRDGEERLTDRDRRLLAAHFAGRGGSQ